MTEHVHVSDLRWDRFLAGELGEDVAAAVRADASGCVVCETRLAQLTRESELFAQRPALSASSRRRRMWWIAAPIGMAAAAAVMLLVRTDDTPTERPKGADRADIMLTVGQPGAMYPVQSGDYVRAGDSLQVGYSSRDDGFAAVLSRDSAGTLTIYVPADRDVMAPIPASLETNEFPGSTILDDTPGEEIVVALWCDRPLDLKKLLAELGSTGDVNDRGYCAKRRVTLKKAPR